MIGKGVITPEHVAAAKVADKQRVASEALAVCKADRGRKMGCSGFDGDDLSIDCCSIDNTPHTGARRRNIWPKGTTS